MNFTRLHSALISKEIFKEISRYKKRLEKSRKTELENKESANSVRTQRHWQASATTDLCIREIENKYSALKELDDQTSWSSYLHQDRFSFVNKYADILEEYQDKYRPSC